MKRRIARTALVVVVVVAGMMPAFGGAQGEKTGAVAGAVNPPPALPIVNEKITLKGFGRLDPQHGPWDEMTLWKDHEERTNIHIEWETPAQAHTAERKNLVLASGDLPDFFIKTVLTEGDMIKFGADGTLIPLEGYIDEWAPNLAEIFRTYPEIKAGVTAPDGHIYGLPRVSNFKPQLVGRYPLLNMVWLERLGMTAPTTSDELLTMLRRFRDEDANGNGNRTDEIPYSSHTQWMGMMGINGMFGVRHDLTYALQYPIKVDNGRIRIMLADPEYREALQFFSLLYREKLMDQEIFTHSNNEYFGKLAAGRMGFTPLYQPRNAAQYAKEYDAIVPPKGPKGHQTWNYLSPFLQNTNAFQITKANRNPEATMRWIDWFYSEEGSTAIYMVKEGVFYDRRPDGSLQYRPEVIEAEVGFERFVGRHTIFPGGGAPGFFTEINLAPGMMGTPMLSYIKKVEPYLPRAIQPGIRSIEQQQRESEIRSDLDVYVTEMVAKFATGEMSFDKWDEWAKTLERLGLRELEEILQESIDR